MVSMDYYYDYDDDDDDDDDDDEYDGPASLAFREASSTEGLSDGISSFRIVVRSPV